MKGRIIIRRHSAVVILTVVSALTGCLLLCLSWPTQIHTVIGNEFLRTWLQRKRTGWGCGSQLEQQQMAKMTAHGSSGSFGIPALLVGLVA